jgi:hypothetical protein
MATNRGFKADLIYGSSGTRKTTQVGLLALYIHEHLGLKTRLVSADPGGWEPIQSLVDAGLVEAWNVRLRPHLIESIDYACQGYWPLNVDDPLSPLQPPVINAEKKQHNGLRDCGAICFEGLTSFGSGVMQKLKVPGVQLSQDPSYVLTDGATKYAGGSMAAFGFVQDRIYDYVVKSHMIPWVTKVLWTALEAKGEEEGTKIPIFGPAIEGKKATGKAGQWFGNMLHMEAAVIEAATDQESKQLRLTTPVFMYLQSHADPNSRIVFPAKVRAPFQFATEVPERMETDVKQLYEYLDKLKERADNEVRNLRAQTKPNAEPGAAAK